MATRDDLMGAVWIAACLIPRDVAPHPNLGVAGPTQVELLALLAQGRIRDFDHYVEDLDSDRDGISAFQRQVVRAARESLSAETQVAAAARLTDLAGRDGALPGARAAAALFSSVAWAELDDLGRARGVVSAVLGALPERPRTKPEVLVRAALEQQLAMRALEDRDPGEAIRHAEAVLRLNPDDAPGPWESFATSRGAMRRAAGVQRSAVSQLRTNARLLLVTTERDRPRSWVRAARTPTAAGAWQARLGMLDATTALVTETYARQVEPTGGGRQFVTEEPVLTPAYGSLLSAELAGDVGAARSRRETVGQLVVLRLPEEGAARSYVEAVRLLRQAESDRRLKPLLRQLRNDGPLSALRDAALVVLGRTGLERTVSRADLMVMSMAADVLSDQEREQALKAAAAFGREPGTDRAQRGGLVAWAVAQEAVEAAAALADRSPAGAAAADSVLDILSSLGPNELLAQAADAFVGSVQWSRVAADVRARWQTWAQGALQLPGVRPGLRDLQQLAGDPESVDRGEGLWLVARLIEDKIGGREPRPDELAEAAAACAAALTNVREEAAQHSYSIGNLSASDISAAAVDVLGLQELWAPLVEVLTDPSVARREKSFALDRFASQRPPLPPDVRGALEAAWPAVAVGLEDPFLSEGGATPDTAVLRMGVAYGLTPVADVQSAAVRWAGAAKAAERLAAARLVEAAAPADWAVVLLLQLAHDRVPTVAATAVRSLAASIEKAGALGPLAAERVRDAVVSDGTLRPLLALRGLADAAESTVDDAPDAGMREVVAGVAATHLSRTVRDSAAALTQRWG